VLALSPAAPTEVYEFCESDARVQKIDPADAGNLESQLLSRRDVESTQTAANDSLSSIRQIVPEQLVAPGLRFHSATETLLPYLSPEIQTTRYGLNENWRRGIKVIFRQ
jgi:hypothetical protein